MILRAVSQWLEGSGARCVRREMVANDDGVSCIHSVNVTWPQGG
jgi:hypothetical protein